MAKKDIFDEWNGFLAVWQLVQTGTETHETIAEKLGLYHQKGRNAGKPNRAYIQTCVSLARLPAFVQMEMRKYVFDRTSTPIRWFHILPLYKAYNAEYTEYPTGNGPRFQAAWEAIMASV